MKLRSLFLASLAAMAMVSCSNEDDQIIDNGANKKDAIVQLAIGLPQSTRAIDDAEGEAYESKVNNITMVVEYVDETPTVKFDFTRSEDAVDQATTGNKFSQNGATILTNKVAVNAGKAFIHVFINPVKTVNLNNYKTYTETATLATLNDLGNIASKDNSSFLMYGKSTEAETIVANTDNKASVTVTRIAAKIIEKSQKEAYTLENSLTKYGKAIKATIEEYTISNLNKETNVANQTIFVPANVSDASFFQYIPNKIGNYKTFEGMSIINKQNETELMPIYCLENNVASAPTTVLYKASIQFEGMADSKNFYVDKAGNFYETFDILNESDLFHGNLTNKDLYTTVDGNAFSDNATVEDFKSVGVKKYTDGICYYAAPIKTIEDFKILRNNVYLLNVDKIKDLGDPGVITPDPDDPTTYLALTITVKAWTVNSQNIEL